MCDVAPESMNLSEELEPYGGTPALASAARRENACSWRSERHGPGLHHPHPRIVGGRPRLWGSGSRTCARSGRRRSRSPGRQAKGGDDVGAAVALLLVPRARAALLSASAGTADGTVVTARVRTPAALGGHGVVCSHLLMFLVLELLEKEEGAGGEERMRGRAVGHPRDEMAELAFRPWSMFRT